MGKDLKVSAITTTTGLFHILPEAGYMWSDDFGLALQARWEFIQQQQATYLDQNKQPQLASTDRPAAPTTQAFAVFGRAIWYTDLTSSGNLRFSVSGDLGGGFVRFPVKPVAVIKRLRPGHRRAHHRPEKHHRQDRHEAGGAGLGWLHGGHHLSHLPALCPVPRRSVADWAP
jgi:hypothetical protein